MTPTSKLNFVTALISNYTNLKWDKTDHQELVTTFGDYKVRMYFVTKNSKTVAQITLTTSNDLCGKSITDGPDDLPGEMIAELYHKVHDYWVFNREQNFWETATNVLNSITVNN